MNHWTVKLPSWIKIEKYWDWLHKVDGNTCFWTIQHKLEWVKHHKKILTPKRGDVAMNRGDRGKLNIGIVIDVMSGKDGIIRAVRLYNISIYIRVNLWHQGTTGKPRQWSHKQKSLHQNPDTTQTRQRSRRFWRVTL